ncbi:MAG: hypothetical protein HUU50_02620 [Candidatus Brocadiae bacterium]|nr:hypothetical protein [Candidatus Brocadiia bacterium]
MAILLMSGVDCGQVLEFKDSSEFPCIDSNYRERTLSFTTLKYFASYNAMVSFDNTTIPGYFSSRQKTISYSGITVANAVLQRFERKAKLNNNYSEYEIVFTKEG